MNGGKLPGLPNMPFPAPPLHMGMGPNCGMLNLPRAPPMLPRLPPMGFPLPSFLPSSPVGHIPLPTPSSCPIPMPCTSLPFPVLPPAPNSDNSPQVPSSPPPSLAKPLNGEGTKWTEHVSRDGRKYYYNAKLLKSQWDKPDELKSPEELRLSQKTSWMEYSTADGRTYWYNKTSQQSVWNMPDEIRKLKESPATQAAEDEIWPKFEDKAEARDHLKLLFDSKKFAPKTRWEEALKILENDKRWSSLVILTKGERKQLFSEYISQAQKRLQDEERRKRQKAREVILDVFAKWTDVKPTHRYEDFGRIYGAEEWWGWVDEKEKDDFFQDFMDEVEKKYRETKRQKRKETMERLKQFFSEGEDITYLTRWKDIYRRISGNETYSVLDKVDIFSVWEDFVTKGEKTARDIRRQKVYREERKRRDAFKELLESLAFSGDLNAKTEWVDVMKIIHKDPRYVQMVGQGGSTPRELFEDKIELLMEEYDAQFSIVKNCVRNAGMTLTSLSSFEWFYETLRAQEEMRDVSVANARLIFSALQERSIEREQENQRRESKYQKKILNLMKSVDLQVNTSYDLAMGVLRKSSRWSEFCDLCPSDESRRSAMDIWRDSQPIEEPESVSKISPVTDVPTVACGKHKSKTTRTSRSRSPAHPPPVKERKRKKHHHVSPSEISDEGNRRKARKHKKQRKPVSESE